MRLISSFQPEELGFLRYLRDAKIVLSEMEFSWSKVSGKGSNFNERSKLNEEITILEKDHISRSPTSRRNWRI